MPPRSERAPSHGSADGSPTSSIATKAGASTTTSKKSSPAPPQNWVPDQITAEEPGPYVGQRYVGLLGGNLAGKPLLSRLDWLHVPLLVSTPLIALYGFATVPLRWETAAFAVAYYFFTGLGITAGACGERGRGEGERKEREGTDIAGSVTNAQVEPR
jgi:hypothetical protein